MNYVLRILGWIVLGGSLVCYVVYCFFNGGFLAYLPLLFLGLLLAVILFGLAEGLDLLWDQQDRLEALENKLAGLLPEEDNRKETRLCEKCGTQLPPGGHVCPTCHHRNA